MERIEIERNFTYHAPKGDQTKRYEELRTKGKELAYLIVDSTPYSGEQMVALEKLKEAIMWANAAIAINE